MIGKAWLMVMKEIRRPEFMKMAMGTKSHFAVMELFIAIIVFFVGDLVGSFMQVPVTLAYFLQNQEYIDMVLSGTVSMERILRLMQNMPDWMMAVMLIAQAGLIIITILYCKLIEKRPVASMGFCKKGAFVFYIRGILLGLFAFFVVYGICVLTGTISFSSTATTNFSVGYLVLFGIGYLIQGMAEEVFCRGYLMVSVSRKYGTSFSVVISALFFSMLHSMNSGMNFLTYVNLFLFGAFLALLMIRYENIWIAGAFHSIWNFAQGNIFGVQVSGLEVQPSLFSSRVKEGYSLMNGGSFGIEGSMILTIFMLTGCIVLYSSLKKNGCILYGSEAQKERGNQEFEYIIREQDSQGTGYQNGEKDLEHANMGLQQEESPWRPKEVEETMHSLITEFDQSYFSEEKKNGEE